VKEQRWEVGRDFFPMQSHLLVNVWDAFYLSLLIESEVDMVIKNLFYYVMNE
jgi:hypothetical protein